MLKEGDFEVVGDIKGTKKATITDAVTVTAGREADIVVAKVMNVYTTVGVAPIMPEVAKMIASNGTVINMPVTWEEIAKDRYNHVGSFSVTGTLTRTNIKAQAIVIVTDPQAAAAAYGVPEGQAFEKGVSDNSSVVFEDASAQSTIEFIDIANHWAKASIEKSVELGFVKGYEDGTFRPNGIVTRGEFATMLASALKLELGDAEYSFVDHKQTPGWAKAFIQFIVKAGFIKGYEDGTFHANKEITRSELVVIAVRARGLEVNPNAKLVFLDADQIPVWARPYVTTAAEAGLIKGNGDGKFNPNASSTRAEAVTLILAMVNSVPAQ